MKYFARKVIAIILVIGLFQLLNNWWYRLYYSVVDYRHAPTISFPIINTMFKEEAALEYVREENIDNFDIYIDPIDIENIKGDTTEEKIIEVIQKRITKNLIDGYHYFGDEEFMYALLYTNKGGTNTGIYEYNPVYTVNFDEAVETEIDDETKEQIVIVDEDGANYHTYPIREALTNDYSVEFIMFGYKMHYAGKYYLFLEDYKGE